MRAGAHSSGDERRGQLLLDERAALRYDRKGDERVTRGRPAARRPCHGGAVLPARRREVQLSTARWRNTPGLAHTATAMPQGMSTTWACGGVCGRQLDRPRLGERGDYSREKLQARRDVMYEHLRDVCRRDLWGVLHMCPTDWTARVTDAGFRRRYRDWKGGAGSPRSKGALGASWSSAGAVSC